MGKPISYDEDVYLWSVEQAAALRQAAASGSNLPVDWENVAEEIESVGLTTQRIFRNNVLDILLAFLKLEECKSQNLSHDLSEAIVSARIEARKELDDSHSLAFRIELNALYGDALEIIDRRGRKSASDSAAPPESCPWTLAQLLDHDYWPKNRHGLE